MPNTSQTAAQRRADNALIRRALKVLEERINYEKIKLAAPGTVRDFLKLRLANYQREAFLVIWLDAQHRLIEVDELFRGTLTQADIYPREVVKSALAHNAGAAILAHNHTSGIVEPSKSDIALTEGLRKALALVDVQVVDHFIVSGAKSFSFAERGLL
jgi:DNA repair protein RadC